MAPSPGTRLGPYEIVAAIGAGGMGEVYKARDTRLDRDVAIKVLPDGFANDPERRARFDREARAIAALSHPNILSVFDTGDDAGRLFVVTELLAGETLRERLVTGATIPVRKAIDMAGQIARGLAAAHDKGIVHRDLKPENVFLTRDGQVKILDFGLARQAATNSGATETVAAVTDPGTVMGTVGYMAPEQIRGLPVDGRADLFALGAVLYEMLSGTRAFKGDTSADTIVAIVKEDPPELAATRTDLPPSLDRVVRHCLEKSANERFQTARDVAFALESLTGSTPSAPTQATAIPARHSRSVLSWAIAALAIVLAVAGFWPRGAPIGSPDAGVELTFVAMPNWQTPEISPDGRRFVSVGLTQDQKPVIWIRSIDSTKLQRLAGAESPGGLFWFDNESVGVLDGQRLLRFPLTGEAPQLITELRGKLFDGASVNASGLVLYADGTNTGPLLQKLPGSAPVPATVLDAKTGDVAHLWPQFLPDGRHFIYFALNSNPAKSSIQVGAIGSNDTRLLLRTKTRALAVAPGFLLFVQDNSLMAQRLDFEPAALVGQPRLLANSVDNFLSNGWAGITASTNGIVGYSDLGVVAARDSELVWFDRTGREIERFAARGDYAMLNLSGDDKKLAVSLENPSTRGVDVWIGDVARRQLSPFLTAPEGEFDPQWSPGPDEHIAYTSDRNGVTAIYQRSVSGEGESLVSAREEPVFAADWSRDGRFVLFQVQDGTRIYYVPMTGMKPEPPVLFLDDASNKDQERFSPDQKWVAYNDYHSGINEVYVVSFPKPGQPIAVSRGGGVQPRWSRQTKELFYLDPDGCLMSVDVSLLSSRKVGLPQKLFQTRLTNPSPGWEQYDVTAKADRFIIITPPANPPDQGLFILRNWTSRFR